MSGTLKSLSCVCCSARVCVGKSTICQAICEAATSSTACQQGATSACTELSSEEAWASRMRGFEARLLQEQVNNMQINVWDFVGRQQYYALHGSGFPSFGSSSLFLFVYSPVVHPQDPANSTGQFQFKKNHDFETEFTYWLKSIASSSRCGPEQHSKPVVMVAVTFMDVMSQLEDKVEAEMRRQEICKQFKDLKDGVQQYIHVHENEPLFLDARSATDMSKLRLSVKGSLNYVVGNVLEVPQVCEKIRLALQKWCLDHPDKLIMTLEEFRKVFYSCGPDGDVNWEDDELGGGTYEEEDDPTSEAEFFKLRRAWEKAALYFTDTGDIMYFWDYVVVNPRWLGRGVLGKVIDASTPGGFVRAFTDHEERGFLDKSAWELQLEESTSGAQDPSASVCGLIQQMLAQNFCFGRSTAQDVVVGYCLPVLLDFRQEKPDAQGDKQQAWLADVEDSDKCFFAGTRLQWTNLNYLCLTLGFFPRLQVTIDRACTPPSESV